jgi:hypothetical protein
MIKGSHGKCVLVDLYLSPGFGRGPREVVISVMSSLVRINKSLLPGRLSVQHIPGRWFLSLGAVLSTFLVNILWISPILPGFQGGYRLMA